MSFQFTTPQMLNSIPEFVQVAQTLGFSGLISAYILSINLKKRKIKKDRPCIKIGSYGRNAKKTIEFSFFL